MQTHETVSSFRKISLGSNRKFGLTFSVLFLLLGVWPLAHGSEKPHLAMLLLGFAFLAAAVIVPGWLSPLNQAWFRLGLALSRVVNPIIMAILFFGVVVPFGWVVRRRGRDPLNLAIDPEASTYWVERKPPGPIPGTLSKQF